MRKIDIRKVEYVVLCFSDYNGALKEVTVYTKGMGMDEIKKGISIDGSSIEGFSRVYESDMTIIPDMSTLKQPYGGNVLYAFCFIHKDGTQYNGDPRFILNKALNRLKDQGFTMEIGVEPEFYLLKSGKYGEIPIDNYSYFDADTQGIRETIIKEIMKSLYEHGIENEVYHHEFGPGQQEINFKHRDALTTADNVLIYKQIVESVAHKKNMRATFMPKPFENKAGNGMHINISLWENGKNIFYDEKRKNLSDLAKYFIGGILEHAKSLCVIVNPTVNSYERLGDMEAPGRIYCGIKSRDALVRIPEATGKKTRLEYRAPDPSCNPYFAFLGTLAAGWDGIEREIEPKIVCGEPGKVDEEEKLPRNLNEALEELKRDNVLKAALGEAFEPFIELKKEEWKNRSENTLKEWFENQK